MGVPIRSIKLFEDRIRNYRNGYVLIIFANAESDSKAVEYVLSNFHEMDITSGDVDFYLPGYGAVPDKNTDMSHMRLSSFYLDKETVKEAKIEQNRKLFSEFVDSHIGNYDSWRVDYSENLRFIKQIHSQRLGTLFFNSAEYVDFVMDFTRRNPRYHYMWTCEMNVVPIKDGGLDYVHCRTYDLDAIIKSNSGISLDQFFHNVFNVIREMRDGGPRYPLDYICKREDRVLSKIDRLYQNAISKVDMDDENERIINHLLNDMNKCLHWSLYENFYFISYSSKNVLKANTLKTALEESGRNVWIAPEGIPEGCNYALAIPTALKFAKNYILLLTHYSAASRWVKRELDIAVSNEDKTRVHVLLADGYGIADLQQDIELNFYLNTIQVKYNYEDVIRNPMILG